MPSKTPARPRIARRPVHGVLLLDKPLGLSSNAALQIAKRLFRAEKAGHTGTLDPLATGLLPLCFGAATKFSQVSLDADKRYTATLQLGVTTTTADAEGEVTRTRPILMPDGTPITRAHVEAVCAQFIGEIDQLPPMHSALKRDGKPLYEYARAGIDIDRQPRRITIHAITVVDVMPAGAASAALPARTEAGLPARTEATRSAAETAPTDSGDGSLTSDAAVSSVGAPSGAIVAPAEHRMQYGAAPGELQRSAIAPEGAPTERQPRGADIDAVATLGPQAQVSSTERQPGELATTGQGPDLGQYTLDIRCSKGTYIRTLAEDIGEALGCGAHLAALRRTQTGPLTLADAWTLEQLQAMEEQSIAAALHSADHLLADWPLIRLDAENAGRFLSGLRRRMPDLPDMPQVRVYGPEQQAFLGSGHVVAGELISDRLLSPIEVQGLLDSARSGNP